MITGYLRKMASIDDTFAKYYPFLSITQNYQKDKSWMCARTSSYIFRTNF